MGDLAVVCGDQGRDPRVGSAADRHALRLHHAQAIPLQLDGEVLALDVGTKVQVDIAPGALATIG
jgi:hypothetical protein